MCGNGGVDTVWCKIWEKWGKSIVLVNSVSTLHIDWLPVPPLLLLSSPPPTPSFHQMIITITITVIDMIMNEYKSDGHPASIIARTRFSVWGWKDPLSRDLILLPQNKSVPNQSCLSFYLSSSFSWKLSYYHHHSPSQTTWQFSRTWPWSFRWWR